MESVENSGIFQRARELSAIRGYAFHFFAAIAGSMVIGFLPEAWISRYYYNTWIEPFAPAILTIAILLGYILNRKLGHPEAQWVWVAGFAWFAFGAYDESRFWQNEFATSRLSFILDTFFGPSNKCGGSECLAEFFFTMPFFATVGYSVAAIFGLISYRKEVRSKSVRP